MRQFPVLKSAGNGLGFLFSRPLAILKQMWLLSLIVGLVLAVWITGGKGDDTSFDDDIRLAIEMWLIISLLYAVTSVRLFDLFLETPERTNFLGIRFGTTELKFFFAWLVNLAIVAGVFLFCLFFMGRLFTRVLEIVDIDLSFWPDFSIPWPSSLAFLNEIGVPAVNAGTTACAMIALYMSQRLSLFPVFVVMEEGLGLRQSWSLTRNSGWRMSLSLILLALMLVAIPLLIAGAVSLLVLSVVMHEPVSYELIIRTVANIHGKFFTSTDYMLVTALLLGLYAIYFQSGLTGFVGAAFINRSDAALGIATSDEPRPPKVRRKIQVLPPLVDAPISGTAKAEINPEGITEEQEEDEEPAPADETADDWEEDEPDVALSDEESLPGEESDPEAAPGDETADNSAAAIPADELSEEETQHEDETVPEYIEAVEEEPDDGEQPPEKPVPAVAARTLNVENSATEETVKAAEEAEEVSTSPTQVAAANRLNSRRTRDMDDAFYWLHLSRGRSRTRLDSLL